MWLARDKDGHLYAYHEIPQKRLYVYDEWDADNCDYLIELKSNLFPNIKWEDTKPTWIRIILEEWINVDS